MKMKTVFLAATLLLGLLVGVSPQHGGPSELKSGRTIEDLFQPGEKDRKEFIEFCEAAANERMVGFQIRKELDIAECTVEPAGAFDMDIDGKMLYTLIVIIAVGAALRAVLHAWDIHFPYTVLLMLVGLGVGFISKQFCTEMHDYTAIARISSKLILFTFLPLLIFESSFSIPVHTFYRSVIQIILVAFPGMLICTFFTGFICQTYFTHYNWTFHESSLFGSIISATDPVAVVAILRELGVSEVLSVMIEGESLLNDGVAILLYEIFIEIVEAKAAGKEDEPLGTQILHSFIQFLRIAVGGPIFGWVMGKVTIFFFTYVFNDPPVEISGTIVAAYLTYWLAEDQLKVSGVMAVVLLGLTMRAERTVISPDSEEAVHHFWSIVGYLANTVLFVIVGIVIAETALNGIGAQDFFNLLLLYVAVHVARLLALTLLYPLLKIFGYGITWQNMIVMMWGGLRGAVGVCLALDVFRNETLCDQERLGAKMLFLTAGIVFLTLVVNGTTTKALLSALRLTEISIGRKEDMKNAVKRIMRLKRQAIRMYLLSPRMTDTSFELVDTYCTVKDPYAKKHKKIEEELPVIDPAEENAKLVAPEPVQENATVCPTCSTVVANEPTSEEYKELLEEARLKVIRGMKVSYTHRNGHGLLTDAALQILMTDAEKTEDKPHALIRMKSFEKFTHTQGIYYYLDKKLKRVEAFQAKPPKPKQKWRKVFYYIATQGWWETFIMLLILGNMVPIIIEIVETEVKDDCSNHDLFFALNVLFTAIFTVEFVIDMLGLPCSYILKDFWSYLDLVVLLISYLDIALVISSSEIGDTSDVCDTSSNTRILRPLRIIRVCRAFRLLRSLIPAAINFMDKKLDHQLFIGLDITRSFTVASEEVLKFLPQMIENKKVLKVVKDHMVRERQEGLAVLKMMAEDYTKILIAMKTKNSCRLVVNAMVDHLHEMIDEGLLDATEAAILTRILELKIKRLWHAPTKLEIPSANVDFMDDDELEKWEEEEADKRKEEQEKIERELKTEEVVDSSNRKLKSEKEKEKAEADKKEN